MKWLQIKPKENVDQYKSIPKFNTNNYVSKRKNENWSCDIMDIRNEHSPYSYVLVCKDMLSKTLMLQGMKSRSTIDLTDAFLSVISRHGAPENINIDHEAGLSNYAMNQLKNKGVQKIIFAHSQHGASHSESMISQLRKLKNNNDMVFDDETLNLIENKYNERFKKELFGMNPNQVNDKNEGVIANEQFAKSMMNKDTAGLVFKLAHEKGIEKRAPLIHHVYDKMEKEGRFQNLNKFNLGDVVRIPDKSTFLKGSASKFSNEEYVIVDIKYGVQMMYGVVSRSGNVHDGRLYEAQLLKTGKTVDDDELKELKNKFSNVASKRWSVNLENIKQEKNPRISVINPVTGKSERMYKTQYDRRNTV